MGDPHAAVFLVQTAAGAGGEGMKALQDKGLGTAEGGREWPEAIHETEVD